MLDGELMVGNLHQPLLLRGLHQGARKRRRDSMNLVSSLKERVTPKSGTQGRKSLVKIPAAVAGKELGNVIKQAIREAKAGTRTKTAARKVPSHPRPS